MSMELRSLLGDQSDSEGAMIYLFSTHALSKRDVDVLIGSEAHRHTSHVTLCFVMNFRGRSCQTYYKLQLHLLLHSQSTFDFTPRTGRYQMLQNIAISLF